jgi:FkbM family methyltransferase
VRFEAFGWGRIAKPFLGSDMDHLWRNAPKKMIRGKWHGYRMELDLSNWPERLTYFLGRYHDLLTQLLMNQCVQHGDRVVDVGANIGMIALHAAALVGDRGLVEAFEPNPACLDRMAACLALNKLHRVRLHQVGLSNKAGVFTLSVPESQSGMGTLATVQDMSVTTTFQVPVVTGDSLLLNSDRPISFVKVDVEGFESRVVAGMRSTLQRWWPIVATEVIPRWLERAESNVAELLSHMRSLNYRPFGLSSFRSGFRHRLRLHPVAEMNALPSGFHDFVWIPDAGPFASRMARLLRQ